MSITADQYYDEAFGAGIRLVLLHGGGDLYIEARSQLKQAIARLQGTRHLRVFECCIRNEDDAESIQVIKLPQLRFFCNGNERHSHVGLMAAETIVEKVYSIERGSDATRPN